MLSSLPYPEAKRLARFFLLDKRISQLATGKQAWLKVQREGKIHAIYTTNGANTGRATHSKPNISGVPRVSSEFGRECRALFYAPAGWKQLGADQSGLELRCLASDMSVFDGGAYALIVTTGDVHTLNMEAAGLSTRDQAKTSSMHFYTEPETRRSERLPRVLKPSVGSSKPPS
ncbi:DNA polymerase [Sphingomonas paeninsulae]|uniref:DNA polymerase n=1 Tax=Sphingomonas paeninsulae TaxID=2319844 RepID=UPI003D34A5E0